MPDWERGRGKLESQGSEFSLEEVNFAEQALVMTDSSKPLTSVACLVSQIHVCKIDVYHFSCSRLVVVRPIMSKSSVMAGVRKPFCIGYHSGSGIS